MFTFLVRKIPILSELYSDQNHPSSGTLGYIYVSNSRDGACPHPALGARSGRDAAFSGTGWGQAPSLLKRYFSSYALRIAILSCDRSVLHASSLHQSENQCQYRLCRRDVHEHHGRDDCKCRAALVEPPV